MNEKLNYYKLIAKRQNMNEKVNSYKHLTENIKLE